MKILKSLNPYEEAEIKEIQEKQRKLHLVPTPVCYLDIDVQDKNGDVVSKYSDRSKSWVRNFYNFCVCSQMALSSKSLGTSFGEGYLNLKDTSGTVRNNSGVYIPYPPTPTDTTSNIWWRAGGGVTDNGIVIGTGETVESMDSYNITSLIVEGSGTNQMNYLAMAAGMAVWDGTGKTMTTSVERNIFNNSGATITVKEIGLIAKLNIGGVYSFLMARDLLSPAVDVAHESRIKVTYTVQIAYP